jgi:SAM-dependent methyltransferase
MDRALFRKLIPQSIRRRLKDISGISALQVRIAQLEHQIDQMEKDESLPRNSPECHFVPHLGLEIGPYINKKDIFGAHHLIRYIWASEVLGKLESAGPAVIMDLACGAGYGSYFLAKTFPLKKVLGIDCDASAIEFAKKSYSLPNLEYRLGDAASLTQSAGKEMFDFIVSFDTIEHCEHRELMMENFVAHLKESGKLLLSSPCCHQINQLKPPTLTPHHRIEYCPSSLYDFLRRYFTQVLRPEDPEFPHLDVFDRLKGTGIQYLLRMNPVILSEPIRVDNPYKSLSDR